MSASGRIRGAPVSERSVLTEQPLFHRRFTEKY
jgi:hypothetical protein